MSPRPTLGERLRELLEAVGERPWPALLALAAGLAIGVGARAFTASDEEPSRASAPVRTAPRPSEPRPEPKPKPKPAAAPDTEERVSAALEAVESYAGEQGEAQVGAAIVPLEGPAPHVAGTVSAGRPWSVMKVPAAAAYLNFRRDAAGAESGESTIPPGTTERDELGQALVQSDNLAIRHRVQEMIDALGPDGTAESINAMLGAGGSTGTQISPAIDPSIDSLQLGTGTWALAEAAEWFRRLQVGSGSCLGLAPEDRVFLLRQLRAAPTALSWGAASVLDSESIALKPGWGSSGGEYTVEQAVIVGNGSEAEGFPSLRGGYVMVLMAVLPSSDPSAFAAGQGQLAELASIIEEQMGRPGPQAEERLAQAC